MALRRWMLVALPAALAGLAQLAAAPTADAAPCARPPANATPWMPASS